MDVSNFFSKIDITLHGPIGIFQRKNQPATLDSLFVRVDSVIKTTKDSSLKNCLETILPAITEMKNSPQERGFIEGNQTFIEDIMKDELKTELDFEPFNKKIQILHSMFVFSGTKFFRSGKVKFVYTTKGNLDVKYTPRPGKGPFGKIQTLMHKRELQKEVLQVRLIKKALGDNKNENIVVDHKAVEEKERIGGQYTVQTKMASGDIEGPLAKKEISVSQGLAQCHQIKK